MLHEEFEIIEVKKYIPKSRTCDFCGKEIDTRNWFRITTGHYDWGSDSCESFECKNACCSECVLTFASEYIKDSYEDKIRNTKHIEIQHKTSIYA